MNNDRPARPEQPSALAVAAKTAELVALETADPTRFAEALADNIVEPDAVETAAFRSEALAFASLAACRYLLDDAASVMRRRRRGSDLQRRTEAFINKVGRERRMLQAITDGLRAQKGMLPNAPNPRQRAMRRLVNENLAGPVAQGRIRVLIEEEREVDRERKRQAKKDRQAARRAERSS